MGNGARLREWSVALDVDLGQRKLRVRLGELSFGLRELTLGLSDLPFGLVERGLEWPGVDLKQDVVFVNQRSLGIHLPDEIAADLWLDVGVDVAVEGGDPVAKKPRTPF